MSFDVSLHCKMSNDKDIFTLKDTSNKEGTSTKTSEVEPSDLNFVKSLKSLNIGTIENKEFVLADSKSGFSLNDLAKAHLNQASVTGTNITKTNDGLNFKLDFNHLRIDQPKGPSKSISVAAAQSNILSSTSTPPANCSISLLAKEHQNSKDKLQNQTIATTSGFKIPSLFGDVSAPATCRLPFTTPNVPNLNSLPGKSIDLSSALLPRDERPTKYLSAEKEKVDHIQPSSSRKNIASSEQLIATIDLLIPSRDNVDSNVQNQKKTPSSLGQVLCRQWKLNKQKRYRNLKEGPDSPLKKDFAQNSKRIKPFLFDVPSPDDIIIAAQSKIFGRRQ